MGRLIAIDMDHIVDPLGEWILPHGLRRYDQRFKPWPNELFPYDLHIPDHPTQGHNKVLLRRCIEQECQGDVAMERSYTASSLTWNLWFQLSADRDLVFDRVIALTQKKDST